MITALLVASNNHPDDFLHYFLGSQPLLGWDRHNRKTVEKNVAYFGCCFCCGLPRVTCAVCFGQHLRHPPSDSLFP
jgi:hypothetical protein